MISAIVVTTTTISLACMDVSPAVVIPEVLPIIVLPVIRILVFVCARKMWRENVVMSKLVYENLEISNTN